MRAQSSLHDRPRRLLVDLNSIKLAHFLVIVFRIVVDGSEEVRYLQLFAPADVFVEGSGYGFLPGLVVAEAASFVDEGVVELEIGCHGRTSNMFRRSHI
jgi:hypothetical protein